MRSFTIFNIYPFFRSDLKAGMEVLVLGLGILYSLRTGVEGIFLFLGNTLQGTCTKRQNHGRVRALRVNICIMGSFVSALLVL